MFPSKPVEYVACAWIGKQSHERIFPTARTIPLIASALLKFKESFRKPMFNLVDVPCQFLDIFLQDDVASMRPLGVRLLVLNEDVPKLSDHHLINGSLYLSGDAELDESIPVSDYKDKHWVLCSQITRIHFTKLYWESNDDKNKRRITLLTLGNPLLAQP